MEALKQQKNHKLELDNHRLMTVTGVKAVPEFSDKAMTIDLGDETLNVSGRDLVVKNLDVENGKLTVTGYVTALKYSSEVTPKGFLKKVFK